METKVNEKMREKFNELYVGFSKLNREERLRRLVKMGALSVDDVGFLNAGSPMDIDLAEKFIENVIGYFPMSLGVATNFVIDQKPYIIPMAVEETSIIAAASKTAKWLREKGQIETEIFGTDILGQIQLAVVKDFLAFKSKIQVYKEQLIIQANKDVAAGLVRRGGGVNDIEIRHIKRPDGKDMAVVHVLANPCDAMGANIMNQICEYLKPKIENLTGEVVTMCILSNLVDSKVTRAKITVNQVDPELAEKIEEGSLFSQLDPYRAATSNKGVLNGIDPILIATGNDWRAVEAGIHAYAAKSGMYKSISKWKREGSRLVGIFEAPIVLGVVGGVTQLHPIAKMSLRMMGIESANELSRVCAAVGLATNLGAIRALTTVGIIEGHMKLHIQNLTLGAGAKEKEIPIVQKKLEEILLMTKRISLHNAIDVLRELRDGQVTNAHQETQV
ncbi:MAG: hydroxymethylglutaryl-CoA reductase, degradative [Bdellovibrionaceae bacterium]|nr:hydroxymethylglutaryl-CoA reductase, degradative [Pseudobdellovibrionaceae bacterium]